MTGVVTREEPVATGGDVPASLRPDRSLRPPSLETLFTALFALCGWILGLRQLSDNSFLWHLRTGQLILDHGIPRADPYSFTVPGARWIAQSWLAELAYGAASRLAGGFGVRLLVAVTGAAFVAATYRIALRTSRNRIRAAVLTTLLLATLLNVWSERPLIFGLAGMVALVVAVELPESFLGRHLLVSVPLTMWCWGNVHGSFELGYAYLALHVIGRWLDGAPPTGGRERKLVIATAASLVALLVNPYGFGLLWFPVQLLQRGSVLNNVSEWQSPNFRQLGGMLYAAWFGVVLLLLIVRNKPSRRDLLVTFPFLFLGLWAIRNVGIAAIVTLPVAGRAWVGGKVRHDDRLRLGWAFMALLLCAGLAGSRRRAPRTTSTSRSTPWRPCTSSASAVCSAIASIRPTRGPGTRSGGRGRSSACSWTTATTCTRRRSSTTTTPSPTSTRNGGPPSIGGRSTWSSGRRNVPFRRRSRKTHHGRGSMSTRRPRSSCATADVVPAPAERVKSRIAWARAAGWSSGMSV